MMLLYIATFITLVGYNCIVQWYISSGMFVAEGFGLRVVINTVANLIIFSIMLFFPNSYYEPVMMILFLVFLLFSTKVLYKTGLPNSLFVTLSFTVNLFAVRLIVRGVYAIVTETPIAQTYSDTYHLLIITLINFAIPILYIFVVSRIVTKHAIDMILVDRDNLKFSNSIMAFICIYIILVYMLVLSNLSTENSSIIGIYVGIGAIVVYLITLAYTNIFANLQLNVSQFEKLSEVVAVEERSIRELKESASVDELTGLKHRSVVEEIVAVYLERNKGFYAVLFDMDGLKTANDIYGHDEGDFYIKKTAKILSVVFDEETVARIGGDEFMVIGNSDDEFACMKKVVTCYRKVKELQTEYNKPYNTSISYGIVLIKSGSKHYSKFEEIYRLSDKRMYAFKKANKKERKI